MPQLAGDDVHHVGVLRFFRFVDGPGSAHPTQVVVPAPVSSPDQVIGREPSHAGMRGNRPGMTPVIYRACKPRSPLYVTQLLPRRQPAESNDASVDATCDRVVRHSCVRDAETKEG